MKTAKISSQIVRIGTVGTLLATLIISGVSAQAVANTSGAPPTAETQTNDLQNIKTKGSLEINRRLTTLNTLNSKINAATKITSSDKTYLTNEVNTEISGLNSLLTQLNGETTVAAARTDAQSIFTEYRVYALVLPKVWLIKTADDEQVTSSKLSSLATKLQTKISADQTAGKDVTSIQAQLTDMATQIANSVGISSSIESKVLTLQPSDYNSDHTLLSGDAAQLKTAHSDNEAAYTDAKSIVAGLKAL